MAEKGPKWPEIENTFDLIKTTDSIIIQYNEVWLVMTQICLCYQNQGLTFDRITFTSLQGHVYKYVQCNIIWNSQNQATI